MTIKARIQSWLKRSNIMFSLVAILKVLADYELVGSKLREPVKERELFKVGQSYVILGENQS